MRKFVAFFTLCLLAFQTVKAQEHLPTAADYEAFTKTRTLVVMDPNPMSDFNFKIQEVMKRHWTVTPFDFITEAEFERKRMIHPIHSF